MCLARSGSVTEQGSERRAADCGIHCLSIILQCAHSLSGLCVGQLEEREKRHTRKEGTRSFSTVSRAPGPIPRHHESMGGFFQLRAGTLRDKVEKKRSPPVKPKWQDISSFLLKFDTHIGSKPVGVSH